MHHTRRALQEEMVEMADLWYRMACEMGMTDGIPAPSLERVEEVKNLFLKELASGHLNFRVATDSNGCIIACAGGLIRTEYAYPLAQEKSLFGWVISVYTLENHRHQGLASQLTEEVCHWLKEKGAKRARLWSSSAARPLYEKLGFNAMMDLAKPL